MLCEAFERAPVGCRAVCMSMCACARNRTVAGGGHAGAGPCARCARGFARRVSRTTGLAPSVRHGCDVCDSEPRYLQRSETRTPSMKPYVQHNKQDSQYTASAQQSLFVSQRQNKQCNHYEITTVPPHVPASRHGTLVSACRGCWYKQNHGCRASAAHDVKNAPLSVRGFVCVGLQAEPRSIPAHSA